MNARRPRIALVTGGSRGIGRAICVRLAQTGVKVGINYVANPSAAEETLRQIDAVGAQGFLAPFHVGKAAEVQEAMKALVDTHGQIDILVNNAGITRDGLLARMKDEEWDEVLATNLKGAFLCSRALLRSMMKQKWGRIINIASVVGSTGNPGQANYAAAKAGLVGFTKALARELASRNITVNCVAPGYIVTDMTDSLSPEAQQVLMAQIPMGALGKPEHVASAVLFLASEESAYITGQTLHVNGGMHMGH